MPTTQPSWALGWTLGLIGRAGRWGEQALGRRRAPAGARVGAAGSWASGHAGG